MPTTANAMSWSEIFKSGSDFIERGKQGNTIAPYVQDAETRKNLDGTDAMDKMTNGEIQAKASSIYNTLLGIGVVLTVIIGGVLGIKFMISSVEDRAEVKKALIPYVLGCAVIYGAFGIWKIATVILNQL